MRRGALRCRSCCSRGRGQGGVGQALRHCPRLLGMGDTQHITRLAASARGLRHDHKDLRPTALYSGCDCFLLSPGAGGGRYYREAGLPADETGGPCRTPVAPLHITVLVGFVGASLGSVLVKRVQRAIERQRSAGLPRWRPASFPSEGRAGGRPKSPSSKRLVATLLALRPLGAFGSGHS